MNAILLNLLEARVTLYATRPDGSLGAPIWSGQEAERLTVRERWIKVETRPSGARFPRQHPLVPQYDLSIDRVWSLPLINLLGFQPTDQTYILEILWTEEDLGQWHRRTFYGVTLDARSLTSQTIETEFVDGQEFQAQYFVADSGGGYTAPNPPVAVPWRVVWSGLDGTWPLYSYDPATGFAEQAGAAASTHAVIAADGSSIQFAGSGVPVLATSATGVSVADLHDQLPATGPQLRFLQGETLLAVVTPLGLWARVLRDGALPAAGIALKYAGSPVAMLAAGAAVALAWDVEA